MPKKPITVLLVLISFLTFNVHAQQKYALIVGINKYYDKPGVLHHTLLQGCVNDAMCMKNMLLLQFGYRNYDIETLLDEQATKEALLDGFENILSKAKKGDAVLFYYSGHGVWMSNPNQTARDTAIKKKRNEAIVMSNLYADSLNCLVRDAMLKAIANKFVDKGIVFTMITDCCFSGTILLPPSPRIHNPYHFVLPGIDVSRSKMLTGNEIFTAYRNYQKENHATRTDVQIGNELNKFLESEDIKAFNLKDALFIHDSAFIIRPSERPQSMFLSLSASQDDEPALEETDETGTRHGIFTKALLDAVKNSSPGISVAELFSMIKNTIKRQMYVPLAQQHADPARLKGNLVGIAATGFRKSPVITVVSVSADKILLHGGLWWDTPKGTGLTTAGGAALLRVTKASFDTAEAIVMRGNIHSVRPGDTCTVTDNYVESAGPLMKVYINSEKYTPAEFQNFMYKNIFPLSRLPNYMDYENWYNNMPSLNLDYSASLLTPALTAQKLLQKKLMDSFVVMLPLPPYIAEPIKAAVRRNQNVELTDNPGEAEYILYLNYAAGKDPHYVLTWDHAMKADNGPGLLEFINLHATTKGTAFTDISKIAGQLSAQLNMLIRERSPAWLNFIPKR